MDIKYREYDETLTIREKASFFEFVQLYVNHRPAHGICLKELKHAFKVVTDISGDFDEASVPYEEFLELICSRGLYFVLLLVSRWLISVISALFQGFYEYFSNYHV